MPSSRLQVNVEEPNSSADSNCTVHYFVPQEYRKQDLVLCSLSIQPILHTKVDHIYLSIGFISFFILFFLYSLIQILPHYSGVVTYHSELLTSKKALKQILNVKKSLLKQFSFAHSLNSILAGLYGEQVPQAECYHINSPLPSSSQSGLNQ